MSFKPDIPMQPLQTTFLRSDARDVELVKWQSRMNSDEGVGSTDPIRTKIISHSFSVCSGLLLENTDTGIFTLFHIDSTIITRGQMEALKTLREQGDKYRGIFVLGESSTLPDKQNTRDIYGRDKKVVNTLRNIIDEELPNIVWHESLKLPFSSWSFGIDALNHHSHVEEMHAKNESKANASNFFDYGDPFLITPLLRPETQVQCFVANPISGRIPNTSGPVRQ